MQAYNSCKLCSSFLLRVNNLLQNLKNHPFRLPSVLIAKEKPDSHLIVAAFCKLLQRRRHPSSPKTVLGFAVGFYRGSGKARGGNNFSGLSAVLPLDGPFMPAPASCNELQ